MQDLEEENMSFIHISQPSESSIDSLAELILHHGATHRELHMVTIYDIGGRPVTTVDMPTWSKIQAKVEQLSPMTVGLKQRRNKE